MKRKESESTLGLVARLAAMGTLFCGSVACSSSSKSSVPTNGDSSVLDAPSDAHAPVALCTGPATGALIDDMSGSGISLQPPSCGTKGTWFAGSSGPLTNPPGDPATLGSCGSACQSLYSPLPAGFPGSIASADGGVTPGAQAMCIAGQTGTAQYSGGGLTLVLAWSSPVPATGVVSLDDGTLPHPVLVDASAYAGIELWLWVSPDVAASVGSGLFVALTDKNQVPEGGVCDVRDAGAKACSFASAVVSPTMAAAHSSGRLFADDGGKLAALSGGWQHVWAPWSSFTTNPYYGGANEAKVDPRALAWLKVFVETDNATGPGIPFNFCIHDLRFLPESAMPALDGGAVDTAGTGGDGSGSAGG